MSLVQITPDGLVKLMAADGDVPSKVMTAGPECGSCNDSLHMECDKRVNGGAWPDAWNCIDETLLCCHATRTDDDNWEDVRYRWAQPVAVPWSNRIAQKFIFTPTFGDPVHSSAQVVIPAGETTSPIRFLYAPDTPGEVRLETKTCSPITKKPKRAAGSISITCNCGPGPDCGATYTWNFDEDFVIFEANHFGNQPFCERFINNYTPGLSCDPPATSPCEFQGEMIVNFYPASPPYPVLGWDAFFNFSISNVGLSGIICSHSEDIAFDFSSGRAEISKSDSIIVLGDTVGSYSINVVLT